MNKFEEKFQEYLEMNNLDPKDPSIPILRQTFKVGAAHGIGMVHDIIVGGLNYQAQFLDLADELENF